MPATHWAGRVTILVTLGVLVFGFAFAGGLAGVLRWSAHCGTAVVEDLWSPLLSDGGSTVAPKPAAACLHAGSGPAAG
jgi:hypothetical protein